MTQFQEIYKILFKIRFLKYKRMRMTDDKATRLANIYAVKNTIRIWKEEQ